MHLTRGDEQVVFNIRHQYGERVQEYSDEQIALAWRNFSLSDEYPDDGENFLSFLANEVMP